LLGCRHYRGHAVAADRLTCCRLGQHSGPLLTAGPHVLLSTRRRHWPPVRAHAARKSGPFRVALPSGSEPNQVVNPNRPLGRERESSGQRWEQESGCRRSRLTDRELSARRNVAKSAGKRRTPRALALGVLSKPEGRQVFRDPKKLPERNPLRNNTLFCDSRKPLRGQQLLSSRPFRCQKR